MYDDVANKREGWPLDPGHALTTYSCVCCLWSRDSKQKTRRRNTWWNGIEWNVSRLGERTVILLFRTHLGSPHMVGVVPAAAVVREEDVLVPRRRVGLVQHQRAAHVASACAVRTQTRMKRQA